MSTWKTYALNREIENLPLMDKVRLPVAFERATIMADELGLDLWAQVEKLRGFFGMRMLIHALLVLKEIPCCRSTTPSEESSAGV